MSCGFARPSLPWKTFSMDRAWRLVVQLENRLGQRTSSRECRRFAGPLLVPRLQFIVMRMDDADRLAEFERWDRPAFEKVSGPSISSGRASTSFWIGRSSRKADATAVSCRR